MIGVAISIWYIKSANAIPMAIIMGILAFVWRRETSSQSFYCQRILLGEVPLTDKDLQQLMDAAKNVKSTPEQKEEQRRSFAFGNTNIENPRVTRETIDEEAEALKEK
jgi:hypothetical protein